MASVVVAVLLGKDIFSTISVTFERKREKRHAQKIHKRMSTTIKR